MSTVTIRLLGGGDCALEQQPSGAQLRTSKSREFGGSGLYFSSTDLLAAALGSCIATDLEPVAERNGVPLDGIAITVDKELSLKPKRIVRLSVHIDLPPRTRPEAVEKLIRAAQHCLVHKSLAPDIECVIAVGQWSGYDADAGRFQVVEYDTPRAFLDAAEAWLLQAEAEYNLTLGIASYQASLAEPSPDNFFATIQEAGKVVGCAFRTPPGKLVLTQMPFYAIAPLADAVSQRFSELPAVLGPHVEGSAFAEEWSGRKRVTARLGMEQRIYQLDQVIWPKRAAAGVLRPAEEKDLDLIVAWINAFSADVGMPVDAREKATRRIDERSLFLWEDDRDVRSMAAWAGTTPNGVRIGYVYTPPAWRGRGYGSSCVAAVSQRALDEGRRFVFLYTDLSNATSNAIYQRIGYRAVTDVADFEFS